MRLPDFIMIGAMKSATSTLHEQLARQRGVFMSTPKEPNFFSDDDVWARGVSWYGELFAAAEPDDLCGESSTHYTKLGDHPATVERMRRTLGDQVRFIYVMRHPMDRLVSHYVHAWSDQEMHGDLDAAVHEHPALIDYGRYAMQLRPYLDAFGPDRVLPVFFERLTAAPQSVLDDVAAFLGAGPFTWAEDLRRQNVSGDRQRLPRIVDVLTDLPGVTALRRKLLPESVRRRLTRQWRLPERPALSPARASVVEAAFDEDLAQLGRWLGIELSCATFREVATKTRPTWVAASEYAA